MKRAAPLLSLLLCCAAASAQTSPAQPPPPPPATATPAQPSAVYTFEILNAARQPVGTFDAAGQLRAAGDLSSGTLLRISRPGASRLFQLARPVTGETALGDVVLVNGNSTVTLGALLSGSPQAQEVRSNVTPGQLNTALGLSTSVGTVSIGVGTSVSVNGLPLALPLILPLF